MNPLHQYMIYDNDSIFSSAVTHAIKGFEIDPKRTAFRSPWQNDLFSAAQVSMVRALDKANGIKRPGHCLCWSGHALEGQISS